MNQIPPFTVRLAACAVLLATTCALPAQAWETVDNYQYTPGLPAVSGKIRTDSLGNIYAVGRGGLTVESDERAVVRRSVDQGNRGSWEDYPEVGFHAGHYRAVAASEDNRLLVGGHIDSAWIIRESLDGGATWSLADDPAPFANDTGGAVCRHQEAS
jgi:hypothetical protein